MTDRAVGIDVGASWMKAAAVSTTTGELICDPVVIPTPRPVTPEYVADEVRRIVDRLGDGSPVGLTLPCVVRRGRCLSALNIEDSWLGLDADELLAPAVERSELTILNDADAAGLGECRFGAGRDERGSVLVLAFGTGLGSALVHEGRLVPNKEYGQCRMSDGRTGEAFIGPSTSLGSGFDWAGWIARVDEFLGELVPLVRPDLIVFAGGVAAEENVEKWQGLLSPVGDDTPIVPARFGSYAAVVGAAVAAGSPSHAIRAG